MRILRLVAVLALAAGCGDSTNPGGGNSVSVEDNLYDPDNLTVAPGTTVTWTWNGAATHNVTWSGGGAPAPSPTQSSGTYTRTFPSAGTFDYSCTVHGPSMSGTVTVQ